MFAKHHSPFCFLPTQILKSWTLLIIYALHVMKGASTKHNKLLYKATQNKGYISRLIVVYIVLLHK